MPFKITFIITNLAVGGAECMLLRLLERLDRAKFFSNVISLTDVGEIGHRIEALGISVETFNMRRRIFDFICFAKLVFRLRQLRPDVVHTWMYHADLIGGIAARLAGVPRVIWGVRSADFIRDSTQFSTKAIVFLCSKWSKKLPRCVLYNSYKGQTYHKKIGYKERQSLVIPNGVDSEKFTPNEQARHNVRLELGIPFDVPVIGLIGRFDPLKNHEGFIKAAAYLHRKMSEVHFLMVGQDIVWSNEVLKKLIEDGALTQVVHLVGCRKDISNIMASLDLLSLTSWSEAFPNVLVEAMACGVPCVSTDVGDVSMILGDTGWVVLPDDMEGMAACWMKFLGFSKREQRQIGERARSRVMSQFDLGSVVNRYQDLYLNMVK